jgi:phytoene synthase
MQSSINEIGCNQIRTFEEEKFYPILSTDSLSILSKYGKTFRWAGIFLTKKSLQSSARLYRFLRFLDDLADESGENGKRELNSILKSVTNTGISSKNTDVDKIIQSELDFILLDIKVPKTVLIALLEGLVDDIKDDVVNFTTQNELLRYCYRVAGTVGIMMCGVFSTSSEKALVHAIDLGVAMQLTNIARDVKEDVQINRKYIPNQLALDSFLMPTVSDDKIIREEIKKIILKAEEYYESGLNGLWYLPFYARIPIGFAAILYREIGRKILRNNVNWQNCRTYLSNKEKAWVALRELPSLLKILLSRNIKSHKSSLHIFFDGLPYAKYK